MQTDLGWHGIAGLALLLVAEGPLGADGVQPEVRLGPVERLPNQTVVAGDVPSQGVMTVRFRLRDKPGVQGTAAIDTAAQRSGLGKAFVERAGVHVLPRPVVGTFAGLRGKVVNPPAARVSLLIEAHMGHDLPCEAQLPIFDLPSGIDLVIGLETLCWGRFHIDGPKRRWQWVVDRSEG